MIVRSLHVSLPDSAAGTAPEWVHLLPSGTFMGADGRGPYNLADAGSVITASMAAGKLALDENHSTDLGAPDGAPSPARGWIVELQERGDGIWGRVEWCESGRQLMADRAYRGISPVFTADAKTGAVVGILRAALTNNPNLLDLHTLHHQQETGVDLTKLRKALGLADTADEAAILAAAEQATAQVSAHAANISAIATAAGAKATDPQGLVTELAAQRRAAGDVQTMAQKVVGLETELNTLKAGRAHDAAVSFIDGAIAAGKPINALRDHYITRHATDAATVEREIGAMVSINAGGMVKKSMNDGGGADELSQEEMTVCEKMGLDPKKFAAQKMGKMKKGM